MSKTAILSWVKVLLGGLVGFGLLSAENSTTVMANLDLIIGAGVVLMGIVDLFIRNLTNSPLGKWWGGK